MFSHRFPGVFPFRIPLGRRFRPARRATSAAGTTHGCWRSAASGAAACGRRGWSAWPMGCRGETKDGWLVVWNIILRSPKFWDKINSKSTYIHIWFVVWNMVFIFHFIYGMSSFPLMTNSYFSKWLLHHQPDGMMMGCMPIWIYIAYLRVLW